MSNEGPKSNEQTTAIAVVRSKGEVEADVFDLLLKGTKPARIVADLRGAISMREVLTLENMMRGGDAQRGGGQALRGAGSVGFAPVQYCTCTAAQPEHVAGEGACARTFCRGFEAATGQE